MHKIVENVQHHYVTISCNDDYVNMLRMLSGMIRLSYCWQGAFICFQEDRGLQWAHGSAYWKGLYSFTMQGCNHHCCTVR